MFAHRPADDLETESNMIPTDMWEADCCDQGYCKHTTGCIFLACDPGMVGATPPRIRTFRRRRLGATVSALGFSALGHFGAGI